MHKPTTHGKLSLAGALVVYLSSVLGGGILVLPTYALTIAGPAALLSWTLVSVYSVPIAVMFGRLSSSHPNAGGVSFFAGLAFGKHVGNLTGWWYFFLLPLGQPAVMLAGVYYFAYLFDLDRTMSILIAYLIISTAVVVALLGKKLNARMQQIIIGSILSLILITIVLVALRSDFRAIGGYFPNGYLAVGEAAGVVLWAYIGIENLSFISSDFEDAKRDFMKTVVYGTVAVGLIYIGLTAAAIGAMAPAEWSTVRAPLAYMISAVSGSNLGAVATLVSTFIVSASALAFVWGGSNLCLALVAEGGLPARLAAGSSRSPYRAVLFQWSLYTLAFVAVYALDLDIRHLAELVGASTLATYVVCAFAYFKLVRDGSRWPAVLSLLGSVVLLAFLGWAALYPLAVMVAYACYAVFRSWRARRTATGAAGGPPARA